MEKQALAESRTPTLRATFFASVSGRPSSKYLYAAAFVRRTTRLSIRACATSATKRLSRNHAYVAARAELSSSTTALFATSAGSVSLVSTLHHWPRINAGAQIAGHLSATTPPHPRSQPGFAWADRHRSKIMLSAFAVSFVAWLMTISAAFANSSNAAVVQNTYWAQGEVDGGSLTYKLGLNVIVVEKDGGTSTTIQWADHACDPITFNSDEHGEVSVERPFCSACSAAANKCIKLVITAMITQVFQITTDLQRTTSYGDLNCQKLFGFSTSVYGMYSTWDSLVR